MNDERPWPGESRLRQALEDLSASIERSASPSAERRRDTLRERARALAARRDATAFARSAGIEVVAFAVADEQYAVESRHVREVYPLRELTPLPCTPPFVRGLISLRGRVLSVIDLKRFFDLPDAGLSDLNRVVVVATPGMELGILADRVLGVRSVEMAALQKGLPTLSGRREQYLHGLTADRLIVLDAERLLGDDSLVVRDDI